MIRLLLGMLLLSLLLLLLFLLLLLLPCACAGSSLTRADLIDTPVGEQEDQCMECGT